jgi:hypothetical protein
MLKKLFVLVFPFVDNYLTNKSIRVKRDEYNNHLNKIENSSAISFDVIKQKYADTISAKDKLEDKAKSNIVAVTIAITLILGASSLLNGIYAKFSYNSMYWFSFVLFVSAVIYMIIAGVLSISVLMNENTVYTISLETYALVDVDLREEYDTCTVANINQNLIRNNGVNTSYECIRNALICLFAIAVMVVFPYKDKQNVKALSYQSHSGYDIVYSSDAVDYITQNNNQASVETMLIKAVNNGDINSSTPVGIISQSDKLFVKANIINRTITVFIVENYKSP